MFLRQSAARLLRRLRCLSQTVTPTSFGRPTNAILSTAGKAKFSGQYGFGGHSSKAQHKDAFQCILVSGQAAIILGINTSPVLAEDSVALSSENDTSTFFITGLRKIEDGSVISNIHTSKWRIFTDTGRNLFSQGKLEEAENLFLSALQEAKEGFGARDPHVASACNNLAELYRVKKAFDKAEPLFLEAVKILEESLGPDDIRVGAALHNLGQFYLVQRKLDEARVSYERALKIKRCVLGEGHTDYADTMYHLGIVLYLQVKEKDAEALIKDSIRIVEEAGEGESNLCLKRLRYLAQIYVKSNRLLEAESVQRKILHILELLKGWRSLDTVTAAEGLALTLQAVGNLREAEELFERCLNAGKALLPEDHIQIAGNILHMARVKILNSNQLKKTNVLEAAAALDSAKDHLANSIRMAQQCLLKLMKKKGAGESRESGKDKHVAFMILLQSLNALGQLEFAKLEILELQEEASIVEAEKALRQCISAYKEFGSEGSMSDSPEVKAEYASCLKYLRALLIGNTNAGDELSRKATLQELNDEIRRVEAEISSKRKRRT